MFASPLGWFEVSNLPETYFEEAAPLIARWKEHREAIFSGTIYPVGAAPDGVLWTGFISVAQERSSAYLLVFRELSPSSDWQVRLPYLPEVAQPVIGTLLGGDGTATLHPEQRLEICIPTARRFLFAQIISLSDRG
jgi:hypothetical protein